jgi:hypothetical protein
MKPDLAIFAGMLTGSAAGKTGYGLEVIPPIWQLQK